MLNRHQKRSNYGVLPGGKKLAIAVSHSIKHEYYTIQKHTLNLFKKDNFERMNHLSGNGFTMTYSYFTFNVVWNSTETGFFILLCKLSPPLQFSTCTCYQMLCFYARRWAYDLFQWWLCYTLNFIREIKLKIPLIHSHTHFIKAHSSFFLWSRYSSKHHHSWAGQSLEPDIDMRKQRFTLYDETTDEWTATLFMQLVGYII